MFESDRLEECEIRKDGRVSMTFDVKSEGLTGTDMRGHDFELCGRAQVVLDRDDAKRLLDILRKFVEG